MYKKIILFIAGIFISNSYAQEQEETLPKFFSATYEAYYKGKKVGTMERVFKKEKNNYIIISNSDIKGKYGFIPVTDKRKEISLFFVDEYIKYNPIHYKMDRTGTWIDFVMDIKFDYNKKQVHMSYKDRNKTKDINANILDNALYQLRLQHEIKNGVKDVKYDIAYKTGFRNYHFQYDKNEQVELFGKKHNLIRYKQVKKKEKSSKKDTYSWFDPERDYVMAQFVYLNDKGKEEARFKLKEYKEL